MVSRKMACTAATPQHQESGLARRAAGVWSSRRRWRRQKGLNLVQVVERRALLGRKVRGVAAGGEGCLPLLGGQGAQLAEGAGDDAAAIFGEAGELGHGAADALALLWRKLLHRLCSIEDALPLLRRHVVELGEPVVHALLHLRRKIAEAGLALERPLLIGGWQIVMVAHPLCQVLLAGPGAKLGALRGLGGSLAAGRIAITPPCLRAALPAAAGSRRGTADAEQEAAKRGGSEKPGWNRAAHWLDQRKPYVEALLRSLRCAERSWREDEVASGAFEATADRSRRVSWQVLWLRRHRFHHPAGAGPWSAAPDRSDQ